MPCGWVRKLAPLISLSSPFSRYPRKNPRTKERKLLQEAGVRPRRSGTWCLRLTGVMDGVCQHNKPLSATHTHTHTLAQVHDAAVRHRNRHVLVRALRASAKGSCGLASCREHPEWFLLFLKLFYLQFCIRYLDHGTHVRSHEYCTRTKTLQLSGRRWSWGEMTRGLSREEKWAVVSICEYCESDHAL